MIAAIFSVFVFSLESLLFDVVLSDLEDPLLFSFEVLLSDFEEFLDSSLFALLSLVLTVEEFEDVVDSVDVLLGELSELPGKEYW